MFPFLSCNPASESPDAGTARSPFAKPRAWDAPREIAGVSPAMGLGFPPHFEQGKMVISWAYHGIIMGIIGVNITIISPLYPIWWCEKCLQLALNLNGHHMMGKKDD